MEAADGQPMEATLEIQPFWITNTGYNVIARSSKAVYPRLVIGAHYDSMPGSVGANDNATGTALVLELARRLADEPFTQWIWFVAFDAEERGIAGSKALAAALSYYVDLQGMVNVEMVGLNSSFFATGTPRFTEIAHATIPSLEVVPDLGLSDHYPFQAQNVPVIVLTRGLHPDKDTPRDTEVDPNQLNDAVDKAEQIVKALLPTLGDP
jgi:aminopeptidase YwaD